MTLKSVQLRNVTTTRSTPPGFTINNPPLSHLAVVHHVADAAVELLVRDARGVGGAGVAAAQLQQGVDVEEGVLARGARLDAAGSGVHLHVLLRPHRATVVHHQLHVLRPGGTQGSTICLTPPMGGHRA